MRKRLRKKQGKDEFAGRGFGVLYVLDDLSSPRADAFLKQFVEEAIEAQGLECLSSRKRKWDFRVVCPAGLKPTEAQRLAVSDWLKARRELVRFEVEEQG